ncbi:ABC-three component system protein [Pseudomonas aeruginosa]
MSDRNTSASASAAGYCYQFVRALHRIFRSASPQTRFGIETADDVEELVPTKSGVIQISEQDKLTTGSKNPLQDSSKNLWNTLRNWLDVLDQARQKHAHLQFVIVTNKPIVEGSLADKLSKAQTKEAIAEAIYLLRNQASSMSGATAEIAAKVVEYGDEDLEFLIENLTVVDAVEVAELKQSVIAALQLPEGVEEHHERIYLGLLGYLIQSCLDVWSEGGRYWTTAETFFTRKHALLLNLQQKPLQPLSQDETEHEAFARMRAGMALPFLEQLRSLDIHDWYINEELGHFWAAYSERTRLLKSGGVLLDDFESAEEKLCSRWQSISTARGLAVNKPPSELVKEDLREIYKNTSNPESFDMKIGRVQSSQRYLYMGTYHFMANADGAKHPIYWHKQKDSED